MIISDEDSKPYLISNIETPTTVDYFWSLDLENMDYSLQELKMFEELTTPSLAVRIWDFVMVIPANWNVLVYSPETSQLDFVEASELTRGGFTCVMYEHETDKIRAGEAVVIDYNPEDYIRSPVLRKYTMLCHHIGAKHWACIAPTDNYNKFLKDKVIGDLF